MSRPRLNDSLNKLFELRSDSHLQEVLLHPVYQEFLINEKLKLPVEALREAFTHSSFSHEYQGPHQEKLEFLGDAVLQLILTQEIYLRYPEENEGRLSKLRSTLVNEKTLAHVAQKLGLSDLILVGKGEFKKKLFEQETVLADTMEALLGQIYRHQGFEVAREKFLSWLESARPDVWGPKSLENFDPKSTLQEKSLAKFKKLPAYTAEAQGEKFLVKLWINGELAAEGVFPSKKSGEKELASTVLKNGMI